MYDIILSVSTYMDANSRSYSGEEGQLITNMIYLKTDFDEWQSKTIIHYWNKWIKP
jgi:hypothetical protein